MSANPTAQDRDPRLDWPDRKEAAARKGVSTTTIRNLEKRKLLTAVRVGGIYRYDPDELDDVDAVDSNDVRMSELLAAATLLVKQSQEHCEKLVALVTVPSQQFQTSFDKLHGRMVERVESLETKNAAMLASAEDALSLQHERHMDEKKFEAAEKRKLLAFEEIKKHIPDVVKAALKRIADMASGSAASAKGAGSTARAPTQETQTAAEKSPSTPPPATSSSTVQTVTVSAPSTAPAIDDDEAAFQVHVVLAKMTDEQIDMMTTAGFVTPNQAGAFKQYRRAMERDAKAAGEAIDTTGETVKED